MTKNSAVRNLEGMSRSHKIVEIGGCADSTKLYSVFTTWGITDPETSKITDLITKSSDHSILYQSKNSSSIEAEKVTYACTTMKIAADESV